jgi:C_GCAxxG_C_C family probable redox protein
MIRTAGFFRRKEKRMDKAKQEEIKEEVVKLAWDYERDFGGCSQAVVGAFKKAVGGISDDVFKAATGLGGGVGLTGNTCGALAGGVMVLSAFLGREYEDFPDPDGIRFESFKLAKELVERFEAEYGSAKCMQIQTKIIGRFYDIWTEREAFLAAGGHDDKCTSVCANAARWVFEILSDRDLL